VQPHAQRRQELLGVHWFGEIIGGAGLQALLAVALHRFGGERDDRQPAELRLLTNNPRKFIGLQGYGLSVSESVPLEVTPATLKRINMLKGKLAEVK